MLFPGTFVFLVVLNPAKPIMARIWAISGSESSSVAVGLGFDAFAEGGAVVPFVGVDLGGSTSILSVARGGLLGLAVEEMEGSAGPFRGGDRVRVGGFGGSRAGERERVRCLGALDGGGLLSNVY